MNPYNPPVPGKKQTCRKCRWEEICIDPCDDCPNMKAVKFDSKGNPHLNTLCPHEQSDKNCVKIVAPTCKQYEPKLNGVDLKLIKIRKSFG